MTLGELRSRSSYVPDSDIGVSECGFASRRAGDGTGRADKPRGAHLVGTDLATARSSKARGRFRHLRNRGNV